MTGRAYWSGDRDALCTETVDAIVAALTAAHIRSFRSSEATEYVAWHRSVTILRDALSALAGSEPVHILLEYALIRVGKRIDAVLLTRGAVLVLEFKTRADRDCRAARLQVEDYALDLQDFHEGSRAHPIIPIAIPADFATRAGDFSLAIPGVAPVLVTGESGLAALLGDILDATSGLPPLDPSAWLAAAYRPVPTLVDAACLLFARHGVEEIATARAGIHNLSTTSAAIAEALGNARQSRNKIALFVTGIPGAGKTLCGLDATFGVRGDMRATFLTGNPTLVHVLREALVRDAVGRGRQRRAAAQEMSGAIQALPEFRDGYVRHSAALPAESVVVIDEAQRCWSRTHAIRKSRDRPVQLDDSEPALLLDIMARHPGFAAVVCLVGGGQEIHTGEGGLAEWGAALRARPVWQVIASAACLASDDPRQVLGTIDSLSLSCALHLDVPVRQIRNDRASRWVDAVLNNATDRARALAEEADLPFMLTRSAGALRAALRAAGRGRRRIGLLASSGAKRLRAEGLGCELPHMDADLVARWFLDDWPDDVRASGALEVVSTEFSCQGLELDSVGLCWDLDLARTPRGEAWQVRQFRGTDWQSVRAGERVSNRINTYRVLLTRARSETIIYVPEGSAEDRTRPRAEYDAIAAYLAACGVRPLGRIAPSARPARQTALAL